MLMSHASILASRPQRMTAHLRARIDRHGSDLQLFPARARLNAGAGCRRLCVPVARIYPRLAACQAMTGVVVPERSAG